MRLGALLAPVFAWFFVCVGVAQPSPDLGGLSIGDILNALNIGFVTDITVLITLETLVTNIVSVNFGVKNPLIIELTIDRVVSSAGLNGTVYATFDQTFTTPIIVPILGTNNSGTFGNVLLTQGAIPTLDIIPLGVLDLINTDVYIRAGTIKGLFGIPIPIKGLKQSNVPTIYDLVLSDSK